MAGAPNPSGDSRIAAKVIRSFPEVLFELLDVPECVSRLEARYSFFSISHQERSVNALAIINFGEALSRMPEALHSRKLKKTDYLTLFSSSNPNRPIREWVNAGIAEVNLQCRATLRCLRDRTDCRDANTPGIPYLYAVQLDSAYRSENETPHIRATLVLDEG
jgi:hypothetical protein